jgi:hypothetical protein
VPLRRTQLVSTAVALLAAAACGSAFGDSVFGDQSSGVGGSQPGGIVTTRTEVATTTTTNCWNTIYSWQLKQFFANGLWWFFYAINNNHVYRTSSNGSTWGAQTTAQSPFMETSGHRIAYYHDGTYLHLVYGGGIDGSGTVFYRRGVLESNGTITWSAILQTVFNDANKGGAYVTVWADTAGYPWVGVVYYSEPAYSAPLIAKVYKSSTNNGTWSTADGFPKTLQSNTTVLPVPVCVPLTNAKVYCGWTQDNTTSSLRGQLWGGDSWDAAEDMTSTDGAYSRFTLAAEGDAVHLAFHDYENSKVVYRKRSAAGAWGSQVDVGTGMDDVNGDNMPVIRLIGTDEVRIHWEVDNIIYRRDVLAGAVSGDIVTLANEAADTLPTQAPLQVESPIVDRNSYMVSYSTGTATCKAVSLLVEE